MKKKRKHVEIEQLQIEPAPGVVEEQADDNVNQRGVQQAVEDEQEEKPYEQEQPIKQHRHHQNHHNNDRDQHHKKQRHQKQMDFETGQKLEQSSYNNHKQKNFRNPVYSRVSVDPSKTYRVPDSRESWGPNVKGKKFRKEKGKKKRCPNAGVRIDGSVKSVRLDV